MYNRKITMLDMFITKETLLAQTIESSPASPPSPLSSEEVTEEISILDHRGELSNPRNRCHSWIGSMERPAFQNVMFEVWKYIQRTMIRHDIQV